MTEQMAQAKTVCNKYEIKIASLDNCSLDKKHSARLPKRKKKALNILHFCKFSLILQILLNSLGNTQRNRSVNPPAEDTAGGSEKKVKFQMLELRALY